MRVEIFTLARVALGHASSLLSLLLCHNNKLSRLDACPSATRARVKISTRIFGLPMVSPGYPKLHIHCFLVFGYPGETLALVVHILLLEPCNFLYYNR